MLGCKKGRDKFHPKRHWKTKSSGGPLPLLQCRSVPPRVCQSRGAFRNWGRYCIVGCFRKGCVYISCPIFTRRSKKYFSRQVSRLQKSTVHNLSFSLARETPKNILKNRCLPVFLASNKRPNRHQNYIPTANRLLISPTRKSICEMSLCPGSFVHDREGVMILSCCWIDLKHWWETGAMDPKTNHISKISQEKLLPRRAFPSHREATTSEHPAQLLLEEKMLKARKLDEP